MASEDSPKGTDNERGFVMVEGSPDEAVDEQKKGLPTIDFATFVISLGTSALFHMGLVPDPSSGKRASSRNLPLAQQTIDTLEMLEVKTRGNLGAEEMKLLESLLYEVRMRFVETSK